MKRLYLLYNRIGSFYVVASSADKAIELLEKSLQVAEYGFSGDR